MAGFRLVEKIEPKGVEVAEGTWVQSDKGLYTRGIYACIGLAVHNQARQRGYLAHIYASMASQDELLPQLFEAVKADGSSAADLSAWLTGGDADSDSPSVFVPAYARRNRAESLLQELGIPASQLSIEWNEAEGTGIDMQLDCLTGMCTMASYYPGIVRDTNTVTE